MADNIPDHYHYGADHCDICERPFKEKLAAELFDAITSRVVNPGQDSREVRIRRIADAIDNILDQWPKR